MKKEITEQLKDLAKEILAFDDNTTVQDLHAVARSLYETLTIQLHLEKETPPVEEPVIELATDSKTYDEKVEEEDPVPVERPSIQENLAEPLIEKIKDIVAQMPSETYKIDEILEEILPKKQSSAKELEDFASQYQQTPTFERKEITISQETIKEEDPKETPKQDSKDQYKPKSLNDRLTKNLKIGLNDRLSITKHLFNGNADDYNRVISQVTTLNSFREAQNFIDTRVKPDYNWQGKEAHVERFFLLIEKRFD
jgi:hypothetical protein